MALETLQDKHVVITGASRGIGRALALECAARGARLTLCARSEETLQPVVAEVAGVGGVLDVVDEAAVSTWLRAGVRQFGPIDVLVNNAGVLGPKAALADYPLEAFERVLRVNVTGLFVVTRAALSDLSSAAVIASMTSYLGRHALPRFGAYCASKFAVEGLARLIAQEHPALTSVAIDPGMVATEMLKAAQESDDVSQSPSPAEAARRFATLLASVSHTESGTTLSLF